jgi:hypothetical protein
MEPDVVISEYDVRRRIQPLSDRPSGGRGLIVFSQSQFVSAGTTVEDHGGENRAGIRTLNYFLGLTRLQASKRRAG